MTAPAKATSLLPAHDTENQSTDSNDFITHIHSNDPDTFTCAGKLTVLLAGLFILLFQFADILRFAPSMRLFELGYCRQYYSTHNPDLIDAGGNVAEQFCKVGEVQEQLSRLKAWLGTLEGAVGLVLVIPYGMLAEVKGGRFVAGLNLIGYALSSVWILVVSYFWDIFPTNAIIVSPLLRAVGGGAPVSSAVILGIVANAAPASKRSTVFFLMGAAELITEMIMPLLSAAFLSRDIVYTPIMLGFVFEACALCAVHAIPLDTGKKYSATLQDTNHDEQNEQQPLLPDTDNPDKIRRACLPRFSQSTRILRDIRVVVLLSCFSIIRIGRQMLEMLVQYISKRFGWSFAQANIVFSIRAAGSLIMLLIILPSAKQLLGHVFRFHTDGIDFLLAAGSNVALVAGSLAMGLASSIPIFFLGLVIFTFGSGCRQSLQSLLGSFVERKDLTRLYTIVALFDGVGSIMGAVMANLGLEQGIHKGGAWLGLPFFVAAGAYTVSLVGMFVAKRS